MKGIGVGWTCAFILTCGLVGQAQDTESMDGVKVSAFTSQLMVSTDFESLYLNLVGTGVRYTRGSVAIAISLFPTLRFHKDKATPDPEYKVRPFVTPGFSVGPLVQYKRLLIGFPSSYSYDYKWHFTVGAGVKFGK